MNKVLFACLGLLAITGCAPQFDHFNRPPQISAPGGQRPEIEPPAPQRIALAPTPPPPSDVTRTGSLWQSGPRSLFGDRRARQIGDIMTVVIEIEDEAEISNTTSRSRDSDNSVSVSSLAGLTTIADTILPGGNVLNPAIQANGSTATDGSGQIARQETITLRLAATVTSVLPNGHLQIRGSQEVRVNYELRDLQIAGIVRPEDISRQNVITYDKIADARIAYGGRGQLTDMQQPAYGQQLVDMISPF